LFRFSWLGYIFLLIAVATVLLWLRQGRREWKHKLEGDPKRAKEKLGLEDCPQCGSGNISLWLGGSAGIIYQCKDCGYRGNIDVKAGKVSEAMKKDLKQLKQELEKED